MKRVIKSGTINSSDNILDMAEDKVINLFLDTMKDYVDEFYSKVTTRCKIPGRGIIARFDTDKYGDFYMDYSCLYNTYSKEDAKLALEIFKKYANIVSMYLDVLKFKHTDIEYEVTKTIVSSARIGKGLYVYNFPFSLPDKYYEGGEVISSTKVENSTTIESSTSTGYSHFISWYDSLTEKGQDAVDGIADSEGLPEYEDCSDSDLNWLIEQFNNEYKTQYEKEFGMNDDPDYLNIKKVSDFLGKDYPDFVEPGTNGYFCKWGDETAIQEYGYDEAQRLCDEIFDKTGVEVNISGNGEFVVSYYR